jgi:hypothetical protein
MTETAENEIKMNFEGKNESHLEIPS